MDYHDFFRDQFFLTKVAVISERTYSVPFTLIGHVQVPVDSATNPVKRSTTSCSVK